MTKNLKSTLIISTYNWPDALEMCLISVLNQRKMPDEVIIADDGSREETKKLIDKYIAKSQVPILHLWHEDKGFRLAEIRNKAISIAKYDYIIQIDGDIILEKNFVADHLSFAKKGFFSVGSRVLLNKEKTERIFKTKKYSFSIFTKGLDQNRGNLLRLPFLSNMLSSPSDDLVKVSRRVRGCNMAFWRDDLIAVNGYNEDIHGWGREDSDISVRLVNYGLKKQKVKFRANQLHLYHKINSQDKVSDNDVILQKSITEGTIKCENGINKSLG